MSAAEIIEQFKSLPPAERAEVPLGPIRKAVRQVVGLEKNDPAAYLSPTNHRCSDCDGKGFCRPCRGTGKMWGDKQCPFCKGLGRCPVCKGTGQVR